MKYAETGFNLEIDLSTGRIEKVPSDPQDTELFLGGQGVAAKILFERVPPDVDAFSPDNVLIFSTGLLNGTLAPAANRTGLIGRIGSFSGRAWPPLTIQVVRASGLGVVSSASRARFSASVRPANSISSSSGTPCDSSCASTCWSWLRPGRGFLGAHARLAATSCVLIVSSISCQEAANLATPSSSRTVTTS